jgi:hypothetical protein
MLQIESHHPCLISIASTCTSFSLSTRLRPVFIRRCNRRLHMTQSIAILKVTFKRCRVARDASDSLIGFEITLEVFHHKRCVCWSINTPTKRRCAPSQSSLLVVWRNSSRRSSTTSTATARNSQIYLQLRDKQWRPPPRPIAQDGGEYYVRALRLKTSGPCQHIQPCWFV